MGKKEIRREYISYKCAATPYTSHDLEIAREKNTDRKLIKRHNVRTHQGQTQSCTRTSLRNPLKSPGCRQGNPIDFVNEVEVFSR